MYIIYIINTYKDIIISFHSSPKQLLYIIIHFAVMDHKYKSLLQNLPTRHVITLVDGPTIEKIKEQLEKLRKLDIVNFFILGNLATVSSVLDAANANNYFGRQYSWYAITQV